MNPRQSRGLRSDWTSYAGFLLNGMGVVILGPLLPRLGHMWMLSDPQRGALLAAQFLGNSLGTILVRSRGRTAIVTGSLYSWIGMSAIALLLTVSSDTKEIEFFACLSLFVFGFGLGQVITTLNLSVGEQARGRTGRLSFGNALWSVGAIVSPLLLAFSLRSASPVRFLLWFAGAFLLFALTFEISAARFIADARNAAPPLAPASRVPTVTVLMFASLLLLYGGAETSFSGWLTTFAVRAASAGETASAFCTSAFWFGVAGGRAVGSGILRNYPERQAMYFLLTGASICGIGLLLSGSVVSIVLWAAGCGALLGPVFPAALASLLAQRPTARQCGVALAACGAGASAMPLLLSVISQRTSSLRFALLLPCMCLLLMLVFVWKLPRAEEEPRLPA